jgi:hypothetical protein
MSRHRGRRRSSTLWSKKTFDPPVLSSLARPIAWPLIAMVKPNNAWRSSISKSSPRLARFSTIHQLQEPACTLPPPPCYPGPPRAVTYKFADLGTMQEPSTSKSESQTLSLFSVGEAHKQACILPSPTSISGGPWKRAAPPPASTRNSGAPIRRDTFFHAVLLGRT